MEYQGFFLKEGIFDKELALHFFIEKILKRVNLFELWLKTTKKCCKIIGNDGSGK